MGKFSVVKAWGVVSLLLTSILIHKGRSTNFQIKPYIPLKHWQVKAENESLWLRSGAAEGSLHPF